MAKIKYQVKFDGEVIGKRTSDRTYTHAIVIRRAGLSPTVVSFCGRRDLADKEAGKWRHNDNQVFIVSVETAS